MKRCPKCNSVFEDGKSFCIEDGSHLVGETLPLPSDFAAETPFADDEEITVVNSQPFVVDLTDDTSANEQSRIPHSVEEIIPPPVVQEKNSRNPLKNVLFLLTGLIIGSVIVLGVLGFGYFYFSAKTNSAVDIYAKNTFDSNTFPNDLNENTETTADDKHLQPNTEADPSNLNGRVISLNAYVRSSPSFSGVQIDILPENDRIEIIRRESPNSPWYEIVCEHGTQGWMHGNTIEFMDMSGE